MNFKKFIEQQTLLFNQLQGLRPKMAQAAQFVYNQWHQEEGDTFGICDEIQRAIMDVVSENIPNAALRDGGWEGDDHAYTIVQLGKEAYSVDIPCHLYERGGGYNWAKIQGTKFSPNDIEISPTHVE